MEKQENIIAPHLELLDEKSLNYKMALHTYKLLSTNGNFFFTSVNLYKYLKEEFKMNTKDFKDKFDVHLEDSSNTMILYPSECPAVIIITLPGYEEETQYSLSVRANANVKAYQMIHQEKMTDCSNKLIVVSVIGAFHQKKNMFSPFCSQCNKYNLVIYKEDLEDDLKAWWNSFFKELNTLIGNKEIKYDFEFIEKISSRLAVCLELANTQLPSIRAEVDEQIVKITLTPIQREILVFNYEPRKIIIGKSTFQNDHYFLVIFTFQFIIFCIDCDRIKLKPTFIENNAMLIYVQAG